MIFYMLFILIEKEGVVGEINYVPTAEFYGERKKENRVAS